MRKTTGLPSKTGGDSERFLEYRRFVDHAKAHPPRDSRHVSVNDRKQP